MIPTAYGTETATTAEPSPDRTYRLCEDGHIRGFVEGVDALKQAIYHILATHKYDWHIYDHGYGFDLKTLIGGDIPAVYSRIAKNISNALLADDRIEGVGDFIFERTGRTDIHVKFTVTAFDGAVYAEEADINV